jgi:hypothetical protein
MLVARPSTATSLFVFMATGALGACGLDANGTGLLFVDSGGPSSARELHGSQAFASWR